MKLFIAGAFALLLAAPATAESAADTPLVVKIHADWCGTCVKLEPTLTTLEEKVGDGARVVILDVTSKETLASAQQQADQLGIRSFLDQYQSKTGTVGVIRASDRQVVEVFKGELDVSRYEAAIAEAAGAS